MKTSDLKICALGFCLALALALFCPRPLCAAQNTYYKDRVAVLMYHHIDANFQSSATITPELFESQMDYLSALGYNFISLEQFRDFLLQGAKIPANSVLVTFDDGYESFYLHAYPVLQRLQAPSVLFIIGEWIDKPCGLPRLTSSQLFELSHDSLVSVQSHTYGLHKKTGEKQPRPLLTTRLYKGGCLETCQEYRKRIQGDLQHNRSLLEKISGQQVFAFAYPFGAYSWESIEALQKTGCRLAFTINSAMAGRGCNPYLIPRINAGNLQITPEKLHKKILAAHPGNQKIAAPSYAEALEGLSVKVYVNGKPAVFSDAEPLINRGSVYVPANFVAEQLQAEIAWNSQEQGVIITRNGESLSLCLNDQQARCGEKSLTLEAPPVLYHKKAMLPVRLFSEVFKAGVHWDGKDRAVMITLPNISSSVMDHMDYIVRIVIIIIIISIAIRIIMNIIDRYDIKFAEFFRYLWKK